MRQRLSVKENEDFGAKDIRRFEVEDLGFPVSSARREEQALELCEAMIDVAAALFNVSSKDIRKPGR